MKSGSCNSQVLTKGNSQPKSSLCPFLCLSPAMWSAVLSRVRLVQAILVCTGRRKAWRMRFPKEMFSCSTSQASLCTRFGQSMYSQAWWWLWGSSSSDFQNSWIQRIPAHPASPASVSQLLSSWTWLKMHLIHTDRKFWGRIHSKENPENYLCISTSRYLQLKEIWISLETIYQGKLTHSNPSFEC